MTDDRLLEVHYWADRVRLILAPLLVLSVIGAIEGWPKWAFALMLPFYVPAAAAAFVIGACRWLEKRRDWSAPAEELW